MLDTNFGTDPEVFIVDKDGCVPPVFLRNNFGLKLDGKVLWRGDEWNIIEDGAATELNINPTKSPDIFWNRMEDALGFLQNTVDKEYGMGIDISPSVKFDVNKYWNDKDERFRDCVRFGCDPHLDIYSGEFSQEIAVDDVELRFGGGHIHMQSPEENPRLFEDVYYYATRLMDIIVGNTLVSFSREESMVDKELNRLEYYGMPGTIRLQEYPNNKKGIEYRVPSNFWINNKDHVSSVLVLMNSVFNLIQNPSDTSEILGNGYYDNVPSYILNFDVESSRQVAVDVLNQITNLKYLDFDSLANIMDLISDE